MTLAVNPLARPGTPIRLMAVLVVLALAVAMLTLSNWIIAVAVLLLGLGAIARPMEPFPGLVLVAAAATFVNDEGGHLTRELSAVTAMLIYALVALAAAAAAGTWRLPRTKLTLALGFLAITTAMAAVLGLALGNSVRFLGLELMPMLALYFALLVGGIRVSERDVKLALVLFVVVGLAHFGLGIYSYAINKVRTGGIFFTPVTGMMALLTLSLALFAKGARPRGWMILLTCLFLVHQLISFARGYWFGLLAALPYLFVVYIRRGEGMRTRIKKVGFALAWVALLVGVGVVVLSVWFGWTDIASLLLTRVASSVGTEASSQTASNIERLVEYRASLRSIASSPLVGHGLGYTLQIHQPIFNVITTQWFVHQTYLWLLLKEGVLGLTAYLLVLVAAVRAGTIGALRSEGAVAGWCAASAACTIYLAGIGLTNFSLVQVNSTFLLGLLWGLSLSLTHVPGYLIRWRIVPGPAGA